MHKSCKWDNEIWNILFLHKYLKLSSEYQYLILLMNFYTEFKINKLNFKNHKEQFVYLKTVIGLNKKTKNFIGKQKLCKWDQEIWKFYFFAKDIKNWKIRSLYEMDFHLNA